MSNARIEETLWTDPKIKKLTPHGKLLFIYLITNPHRHYSGIYYLPLGLIPIETSLNGDTVKKELNALIKSKIVYYDEEFSMIFLPKMFRYQAGWGENLCLTDKHKTGVINHLKSLHNNPLIKLFLKEYKELSLKYTIPIETPLEEDTEPHSNPIRIQSQSQSQSQSQVKEYVASFFTCQFFDVDIVYRAKLKTEYPAMTDELLLKEFSRMEDWLTDNKGKKRFGANGKIKNVKLFIKNWLDRTEVRNPAYSGTKTCSHGLPDPRDCRICRDYIPGGKFYKSEQV